MEKAIEKEIKANDKWADKIKMEEGVMLEMDMGNYQDWINFFIITTRNRKCQALLTRKPNTTALEKNNALNIGLLFIIFIDDTLINELTQYVNKDTDFKTISQIRKSQLSEEAPKILLLKMFMEVDANDIEEYCKHHIAINGHLLKPNKYLEEAKAPAFIARMLDDLEEEQQLKIPHLMAKYEDTSGAIDLEIFSVMRDLKEIPENNKDGNESHSRYKRKCIRIQ